MSLWVTCLFSACGNPPINSSILVATDEELNLLPGSFISPIRVNPEECNRSPLYCQKYIPKTQETTSINATQMHFYQQQYGEIGKSYWLSPDGQYEVNAFVLH